MARKYSKRTKSTKRKTYKDYLLERSKLEDKGYALEDVLTESEFEAYYNKYSKERKEGIIKSSPFQELMRREKLLSTKQAKNFALAYEEKFGEKITLKKAKSLKIDIIRELGAYITATKSTGLYGGDYE